MTTLEEVVESNKADKETRRKRREWRAFLESRTNGQLGAMFAERQAEVLALRDYVPLHNFTTAFFSEGEAARNWDGWSDTERSLWMRACLLVAELFAIAQTIDRRNESGTGWQNAVGAAIEGFEQAVRDAGDE